MSGSIRAVIVGAGQSGLAASWHLSRRGIDHVVLERGRVGETWRSQRWDSFALNSPNWMNRLPGEPEGHAPREAFLTRDKWIDHLEAYADGQGLPVRTATAVTAVTAGRQRGTFVVATANEGDGTEDAIEARHVIVASGAQSVPKIPALSTALPPWVRQLHTADYRAPTRLPSGAVLVVGSAQSGVQVVEDLLDVGRSVYLCTSAVPRLRRRQRGRDSLEWLTVIGFNDMTPDRLPDPRMQFAPQPQISGVGPLGHTVSLQDLAVRGARLLGRPVRVEGDQVVLDDSLGEASGVSTVIWATGFDGDFGFLPPSVFDDRGLPIHDRGAAGIPGLHFMGLRWMTKRKSAKRKSALILGADADAADLAERIAQAGSRTS